MQFYFPTELGHQLAFLGASLAAVLGIFTMFAPRLAMRFFDLLQGDGRDVGTAIFRLTGGMMLGLGLIAILFDQDFIYIAIGAAFGVGLFGLFLSVVLDRHATLRKLLFMVVITSLVALPLTYVFGLV